MSEFDANPFADPEAANPFADASVRQATQPQPQRGMDDYNPFEGGQQTRAAPAKPPAPTQPAVMRPTEQPPAYTPTAAQSATDDLQRRQEELEKKAAELQKREQDLKNLQYNTREHNFPPLPACCPVKPCFYQDFSVDIPLEFQRIVKIIYYLWLLYFVILILNMLGCLAYFIASSQGGISNNSGVSFGMSILYLILFTPCSFVCWYRPLYKAFRSDSSFNFFVFFFIFFFQFIVMIMMALGIDGWGSCGFINGLGMVTKGGAGQAAIGGLLIVIGFVLGLCALAMFILLVKVHRIYRSTGASFAKAQEEFATGVMSNKNVQNAAVSAASTAARSSMQQGANKY